MKSSPIKLAAMLLAVLSLLPVVVSAAPGTPLTPVINLTNGGSAVARNAAGEMLFGWSLGGRGTQTGTVLDADCWVQRRHADGSVVGSPIQIASLASCGPVAIDAAGEGAMLFYTYTPVDVPNRAPRHYTTAFKIQRLHADGSLNGAPIDVASTTRFICAESLAMNSSGAFAVAWIDASIVFPTYYGSVRPAVYTARMQLYNGDGSAKGGLHTAQSSGLTLGYGWHNPTTEMGLAMADDGSLAMSWLNPTDVDAQSGGIPVYAKRFAANGMAKGSVFVVDKSTQLASDLSFSGAPDGSFAIAWRGFDVGGVDQHFVVRYGPDGEQLGVKQAFDHDARVSLATDGSYAIGWATFNSDGYAGPLTAQIFNATATPTSDPFTLDPPPSPQHYVNINWISLVNGQPLGVIWTDYPAEGAGGATLSLGFYSTQ